jgi:hypothetical protein
MRVVRLALCSLFTLVVIFHPKPAAADFTCCNQWIREPGSAGLCRNSTEGRTCCQKGLGSMKGPQRAQVCASLKSSGQSCSEARPYCPIDCDQLAQELRAELQNAANFAKSPNYNTTHLSETVDSVLNFNDTLAELQQEWATLKKTCPNIGSLVNGQPDGQPMEPPTVIDIKSPSGQKLISDRLDSAKAHAAADAAKIVAINTQCSILPNATIVGTPGGVGGQAVFPGPPQCAQVNGIQAVADDYAAQSELAATLTDLKADPLSNDFPNVVTPSEVKLVLPETTSPIVKRAGEALLAFKRVRSYLDAYKVSYERYQGASAANKAGYMWVQASAMEDFANRASTENVTASSGWSDYEHETNKELTLMAQQSAQAGIHWNDHFNDIRAQLRDQGLPTYIVDTLRANGRSQADIDALQQAVLAVTEQQIETEMARMRADAASVPAVGAVDDTLASFLRMLRREAIRLQTVPDN